MESQSSRTPNRPNHRAVEIDRRDGCWREKKYLQTGPPMLRHRSSRGRPQDSALLKILSSNSAKNGSPQGFLLTAGHAGDVGTMMYRFDSEPTVNSEAERKRGQKIGRVGRNALKNGNGRIDAAAMRFAGDGLAPHFIYGEQGNRPMIGGEGVARRGQTLCISGSRTNHVRCGPVVGIKYVKYDNDPIKRGFLVVDGLSTRKGDSGAPAWNPRTHASIGIVSGGHLHGTVSYIQPLLNTPTGRNTHVEGALNATQMGNLQIIRGG